MYLDYKKDPSKYWVLDTEANSLQPTQFWCAVAKNLGTKEVIEFDTEAMYNGQFTRFLDANCECYFIGHNIISFDTYWLRLLFKFDIPIGNVVDTLVLSYLYHPHLPNGHSLDAYGERVGRFKIGHDDWTYFSPEMMARCRQDVEINELVYIGLCDRMNKIGFSEKSCEIEHRIRYVIDKQQKRGFYFDTERAIGLRGRLQEELEELRSPIYEFFPPVLEPIKEYEYKTRKDGQPFSSFDRHQRSYDAIQFNDDQSKYTTYQYKDFDIASPQQRIEKLLSLGWEPTEFTPKTEKGGGGNPKINEDELNKFAELSGIKEVKLISDWVVRNSRLSTINSWLSFCDSDSRIHGTVFTCGANTRRMRHTQPNTSNIVKASDKVLYGKELRGLWQATPGRVEMGYDVSGLEMRGFCHYLWPMASESDKKFLLDQYITGKPHGKNAEALTTTLKFPVTYDESKTAYFAFLYGAGDNKLGKIIKKSIKDGSKVRATLMSSVPGLRDAVEAVQAEWGDSGGLLRCIDGGFVRCPGEHAALNYQIQSAGAIVCKLAAIKFDKIIEEQGLDIWQVAAIHDEYQNDCVDQETADIGGKLAVDCIKQAGEELGFNVELTGEYKTGLTWSDCH